MTTTQTIFQRRWYDSQWEKWDDWVDVEGRVLDKYGETPEEWIVTAMEYLDMGATYEYRIIERTDETLWEMSFKDKPINN